MASIKIMADDVKEIRPHDDGRKTTIIELTNGQWLHVGNEFCIIMTETENGGEILVEL